MNDTFLHLIDNDAIADDRAATMLSRAEFTKSILIPSGL